MATRARVNPTTDTADPPDPAATNEPIPISCVCPVCKSAVTFSEGVLAGGDPSSQYSELCTSADRAGELEIELAAAKQKLAELDASAAGDDDDPPAPPPPDGEPHYFL